MEKSYSEMTETELREIIEKRQKQWQSAEDRVDKFGSIKCQGQAQNYLKKYADLLVIAYQNGFKLSDDEKQIASLVSRRLK